MNGKIRTESENSHAGHRKRLRQRFLENGLKSMYPHEALELMLFYSIPRSNTNIVAHDLINRFGDIPGVFNASYDELTKVRGVGDNSATLIKMIPQLFTIYASSSACKVKLDTSEKLCRYFISQFAGVKEEQMIITCLDSDMCIVRSERIAKGNSSEVTADNKSIAKAVISSGCKMFVVSHNHPFASCEPSKEDIDATNVLAKFFKQMGITLIEHVIVGCNGAGTIISNEVFLTERTSKRFN